MILFEPDKDSGSVFAIERNVTYENKVCEELLYAEITKHNEVIWEDRWDVYPPDYASLDKAKEAIENEYREHRPFINGKTYPNLI